MIANAFLLVVGLVLILYGARLLVEGAASIAKRFNVSDLVIGLTVVAFGTSMPELVINVFSALKGSTGIAIGNVLGSNIANILLILGLAALVRPLTLTVNTQWKEIPFSLLAALVLGIMANDVWLNDGHMDNEISLADGLILLCFLAIFMVYTFEMAIFNPEEADETIPRPIWMSMLFLTFGVVGLYFGGQMFVDGAIGIARTLGWSERLIGLTIVAVGTSIPELATSVVAAWNKRTAMAIGNVIGSNILNVFLILGVTAVIKPLPFITPAMNHDLAFLMVASALLFVTTLLYSPRRIGRRAGGLYLFLYIAYIASLIFVHE
ncbi:MAG: K+-dependent Na+/Ca+ exchanger [Saprospiraceae bacterium]|nr:MAG: K+-dependent Na+/Ca+ exchanger [Saprospiraceae bacterium]